MKKIFFKKTSNLKNNTKRVVINSTVEDKDCWTVMRKSFVYKVSKTDKVDLNLEEPQVYIKKSFDTRKSIETFNLKVQGKFYMNQNRVMLEVKFQHKLNIEIQWKTKIVSPKKSEILT